jgi:hypothetical protein
MSDGFEAAKGQRNLLERLGDKIPGYRGFQNRELRRDVDRIQREHLGAEVGRLKSLLQGKVRDYTDAGRLTALNAFVRLDRQLDGLGQTIRFSDYGASGLFDPVKIGEPELERLYQFDLSIVEDLATVEQAIAAIPPASAPAGGAAGPAAGPAAGAADAPPGAAPAPAAAAPSLDSALDQLRELVQALDDKWRQRRQLISGAVQAGQGA